jgi:hypothetical protein
MIVRMIRDPKSNLLTCLTYPGENMAIQVTDFVSISWGDFMTISLHTCHQDAGGWVSRDAGFAAGGRRDGV